MKWEKESIQNFVQKNTIQAQNSTYAIDLHEEKNPARDHALGHDQEPLILNIVINNPNNDAGLPKK
jgi:hypothetical protein